MLFTSEGRPADYVFLEVNEAFERLTGLKRERILGEPATEVIHRIATDPVDWIWGYGKVVSFLIRNLEIRKLSTLFLIYDQTYNIELPLAASRVHPQ